MPETKRPLKVFLCHASADKPKVRELYRYLRKRGIKPWFDEVDLIGGQDWQMEIPKAIKSSDAIVVCLTKNSIDKEGYVQKEVKFALDKALEMPEGRIYLIPVRFEECEVPYSLSRYQWVDLFEQNGFPRLMKSLKTRASQLERATVQVPQSDESSPNLTSVSEEKIESEAAEKVAHEKAKREATEKTRLKADELLKQKAAKIKAEREAAEKAAREIEEKRAAERARLEAEERARQKAAKIKEDREAAKKAAREEERRILTAKAKLEAAKRQSANVKSNGENARRDSKIQSAFLGVGFLGVIGIFGIVAVIIVFGLLSNIETPLLPVSVSSTSTKTALPSTITDASVPTVVTLPITAGIDLPFTPPEITTKNSNSVQLIRLIETGDSSKLSFSPTGEILAAGFTRSIVLFDANALKELRSIPVDNTTIVSLAFSPDGSIIAAGTSDGTIYLWNAYDGNIFQSFTALNSFVWHIVFSPDGKTLASSDDEGIVQLWNISDGTSSTLGAFSDRNITSLVFSNDGKTLTFGTYNKWNGENDIIYFWNVSGNTYSVIQGFDTNDLAYSPDGKILAGAGWKAANMWRVSDNSLIRTLDGNSDKVDFSPNGDIFATGGETYVRLWQASDGKLLKSFPVNTDYTAALEFSPDGTILATVSSDGVIRLWGVKP